MVLTLDDYLQARPGEHAEIALSSEAMAARAVLPLLAARLAWSAALGRRVAYLPDNLLARAPGACLGAIRAHYGSEVLVAPASVAFP